MISPVKTTYNKEFVNLHNKVGDFVMQNIVGRSVFVGLIITNLV